MVFFMNAAPMVAVECGGALPLTNWLSMLVLPTPEWPSITTFVSNVRGAVTDIAAAASTERREGRKGARDGGTEQYGGARSGRLACHTTPHGDAVHCYEQWEVGGLMKRAEDGCGDSALRRSAPLVASTRSTV